MNPTVNENNPIISLPTQAINPHPQSELPPGWRISHEGNTYSFKVDSLEGQGTFGKVYKARILETSETVAIKQVEIQPGYEFREVQILSSLEHRNVCKLKMSFTIPRPEGKFTAFIVMEYVSSSLFAVIRRCRRQKRRMTDSYIMLLMYQLLKGLSFIHSKGVCHRDLKPANILLNLSTNELKICDFGSAKVLKQHEKNATYICSRFYRAPELILSGEGAYTQAIDMWSVGCIFAELHLSEILFQGSTSLDQIVEIIHVIGTPTESDLEHFGRKDTRFALTRFPPRPWNVVLGKGVGEKAVDLLSKILVYSPIERITADQALRHEYFDPIRQPEFSMSVGHIPQLFDSEEERKITPRDGGDVNFFFSALNVN